MGAVLPGDREGGVPRAGWVKMQDDQRLSDHVALGVLTGTLPPGLVDEVLADTAAPSSARGCRRHG